MKGTNLYEIKMLGFFFFFGKTKTLEVIYYRKTILQGSFFFLQLTLERNQKNIEMRTIIFCFLSYLKLIVRNYKCFDFLFVGFHFSLDSKCLSS